MQQSVAVLLACTLLLICAQRIQACEHWKADEDLTHPVRPTRDLLRQWGSRSGIEQRFTIVVCGTSFVSQAALSRRGHENGTVHVV